MSSSRRNHWNGVYRKKHYTDVSWYQAVPDTSLEYILATGISRDDPIIDIGGGASLLVDCLIDHAFTDVSVLDVSAGALEQAKARLGERATRVHWIESDVADFEPDRTFAVWHDRAALHFLVDAGDRERYVDVLRRSLRLGGYVILATFGPDGPLKCSGLEIRRYNIELTRALLGPGFELQGHRIEDHGTPGGAAQQFLYSSWIRTR